MHLQNVCSLFVCKHNICFQFNQYFLIFRLTYQLISIPYIEEGEDEVIIKKNNTHT